MQLKWSYSSRSRSRSFWSRSRNSFLVSVSVSVLVSHSLVSILALFSLCSGLINKRELLRTKITKCMVWLLRLFLWWWWSLYLCGETLLVAMRPWKQCGQMELSVSPRWPRDQSQQEWTSRPPSLPSSKRTFPWRSLIQLFIAIRLQPHQIVAPEAVWQAWRLPYQSEI